ncbi:MAG: gluconolactonase [Lachnospiraceae bacterium]|nr:gluconolactonase [Lachnospiraceae bacterium]
MKRWISFLVLAILLLAEPVKASAQAIPYDTYNYDSKRNVVFTPAAYVPEDVFFGSELSCGDFAGPKDMFITKDGTIYVADTGNNRIVVMNIQMELLRVIDSFENQGETDTFKNPSGLFCDKEGTLYIADTDNKRIVILNAEGKLVDIISDPKSDVLGDDFKFVPLKVSVDYAGRVYVIVSNVYQGIMAFNQEHDFMGYFGTINVRITLAQRFWRLFSTKEQRSRQQQFIPTEFTNIDIDEDGFVYATNLDSTGSQAVRKLNPKGIDVINATYNSKNALAGDMGFKSTKDSYQGASRIIDVKVREDGIFSLLDSNRGRIFTYDNEGNILYIFGGMGTQEGTFYTPVALEAYGEKIYVLDSYRKSITIFEPTQYGGYINEAVGLRFDGDETKAVEVWKKVLALDSNNEMAYSGIGKAYLSAGDNEKAMYYLKMGVNQEFYSIAYKRYRNEILRENMGGVLNVLLVLVVGGYAVGKIKKIRMRRKGL